ncbi:MAG: lipopolysaccharide biosynthesis protein RfbH [Lamprobacter sp.]|uniref:lipopolysaccharide biosynthesis protein RfbH n=1 Tax=Lamprobacter sp. TaxID=3100796 RepID=UPI002B2569D3|nr:lipopolysaccharide biosynthesis protein RfbH [Lamprobacter sp.]MEA3641482.1 lipopolysaccharide biosynthesis protein RfbH [Lamprobacter sp.]
MLKLGDLVLLDFPYTNRRGSKVRPGVVLAMAEERSSGDLQVAYVTSEVDNYSFDTNAVPISSSDLAEGHLKCDSVARVDKVITIHHRQCRKVARLNAAKCDELLRKATAHRVSQFAHHAFAPTHFQPGQTPIPAAGKVIDGAELHNMVEAALDGWLTTGRFNDAFEQRLAEFLGVKHLITVNSGSSANLIALSALTSPKLGERAIRPGDEVITVAAGFPTTVNPILQVGAVPVFLDVELGTYNIDVTHLEEAIGPRTKAIMLAHTLGNPFNLDAVTAACRAHGLWLVEDCCDALGSTYRGQLVGTFGDIATLSFYPAHHITMGEGGAVFTNNAQLKIIAESFRDWGRDCFCAPGKDNTCKKRFDWQLGSLPAGYDHKYTYSHAGYNLKITDMQAACGLAQLDKLPDFIARRKANFISLKEQLRNCEEHLILPELTLNSDPSWFGFPVTLRPERGIARVELLRHLDQCKIGTRLLFGGNLTCQPYFEGHAYRMVGDLVNTGRIMRDTFWIGLFPGLSNGMLEHTAACIAIYLSAADP